MKNYSKITENKDILTKEYADSTYANKSSVNNGTLTIQKNGTTVKTFSANQSGNVTANITVPTKVSELENDSGFTSNAGTITGIKMNGASKGTSGVVDLGTVLTNASAFATAAQGTKADNAMPKSGGTFTGNISVPKTITFTDNTNPFIKMTTGGTDFYFQSTSGQFGLGPTWEKATHWDANGNVTFPTTPKVSSTSLALTSQIPTSSTVSGWGFTKNTGTVTSVAVKMNGAEKGKVTSSGTIDLGTVITAHQDISGKANLSGGNTFKGKQTFTDPPTDNLYSIDASGYIRGSSFRSSTIVHNDSHTDTDKVCVFTDGGWIYYRTPAEIVSDGGGATTDQIPTFSFSNGVLTITT